MSDAPVGLDQHLFHDQRLPADGTMSCASCHKQARALTDGRLGQPDPPRDLLSIGFPITEAGIADLTTFPESLTDEVSLIDPAFSKPWPEGHPATGGVAALPEDPS